MLHNVGHKENSVYGGYRFVKFKCFLMFRFAPAKGAQSKTMTFTDRILTACAPEK